MPTGIIFMHDRIGSLFIDADDEKYYQPDPEVDLAPGTKVTFQVLNKPGAPPGFYFAQKVEKVPDPEPVVDTTPQPPSKLGVWAKPLPSSITTQAVSNPTPSLTTAKPKVVVSPALPSPSFTPRVLTNKQTREDFQAIQNQVGKMKWGQQKGYGPSLQVTTKLKWEGEGIELYNRVLEEYQDQPIPGEGMYYYVGTMGVNFGKGGFRISAHTHNKANIAKSTTYTVLHIEN